MRKVRQVEAIDVETNVRCHAPDDERSKGKRALRKPAKGQNRCRMRKRPRHEGEVELVHLLRDDLEDEGRDQKGVRIFARLDELLLNQLDKRIVDPA